MKYPINLLRPMMLMLSGFFLLSPLHAQDLLDMLGEEETEKTTQYATATFKSTRVINGHSTENAAAGVLDFRVAHRFGYLSGGAGTLFGLDAASMRIGFEYGVTDRLMLGIGRSTYQKALDGFVKYKILRQSTGLKNMPISMSYFVNSGINTLPWVDPNRENFFSSRMSYTHQLLIARKFNEGLSIQISPSVVHRNLVSTFGEKNDVFALGIGGRQKISTRTSVNAEYFFVPPGQILPQYQHSLSLGLDIETGGHVFQLHLTNSQGMIEQAFITESQGDWLKGNIRFGFNISRVFTLKEPDWKKE